MFIIKEHARKLRVQGNVHGHEQYNVNLKIFKSKICVTFLLCLILFLKSS